MNTAFENVVNYDSDLGKVYIFHLGIKEFSDRFNIPIKYILSNELTTEFEPRELALYMNFVGSIEFNKGNLILNGEISIFEGMVKLQREIHPETDVIIRIYDNLNDDQVRNLLKPKQN